ncbi:hypothetical protein [Micromonospora sp. B9E7]|uniref:hypothetical protein n=1 Tax=Micromonospora sp. B9E7 TaxID=3153574 RepID=UPI00325D7E4C
MTQKKTPFLETVQCLSSGSGLRGAAGGEGGGHDGGGAEAAAGGVGGGFDQPGPGANPMVPTGVSFITNRHASLIA